MKSSMPANLAAPITRLAYDETIAKACGLKRNYLWMVNSSYRLTPIREDTIRESIAR